MRVLLASVVLACLGGGPAWAQLDPCLSNPVACVEDATSDVPETIGGTVEDATGAAEDTAGGVTDTGQEVLDGATGGGDAGGGEQPAPESSGGGESDGSPGGGNGRRANAGGDAGATVSLSATVTSAASPVRERSTISAPAPAEPAPDLLERIRRAFSDSAGTFVFPLALIGLVAGFLLVQTRFDRSDPKLALAHTDPRDDILEFR